MVNKLQPIFQQFQVNGQIVNSMPIEIGHINETYKITLREEEKKEAFILQKINTEVFQSPQSVMENIIKVGQFLQQKNYPKKVLLPIQTINNQFFIEQEGCWRVFPFIKNTITYNEVDTPEKAYQAAFAFGEYGRFLNGFDANQLVETIPDFHNTILRFQQFRLAIKMASDVRIKSAQSTIDRLLKFDYLLDAVQSTTIPLRVTHNDTKINNILFDKTTQQPVCIIDLDTLMPGTLLYDFGDMVRTFTPTLDENSADYDQIFVRKNILTALTQGYIDGWHDELTALETALLLDGAKLTIFEQALRFLTDYLAGNLYYKIRYEQQNLVRARNQVCLLDSLNRM